MTSDVEGMSCMHLYDRITQDRTRPLTNVTSTSSTRVARGSKPPDALDSMLLPAWPPDFTDSELLVLRTATCRAAWLPPRIAGATSAVM